MCVFVCVCPVRVPDQGFSLGKQMFCSHLAIPHKVWWLRTLGQVWHTHACKHICTHKYASHHPPPNAHHKAMHSQHLEMPARIKRRAELWSSGLSPHSDMQGEKVSRAEQCESLSTKSKATGKAGRRLSSQRAGWTSERRTVGELKAQQRLAKKTTSSWLRPDRQ